MEQMYLRWVEGVGGMCGVATSLSCSWGRGGAGGVCGGAASVTKALSCRWPCRLLSRLLASPRCCLLDARLHCGMVGAGASLLTSRSGPCCFCAVPHRWRQRAAFLMVYIAEAHAADEWPISSARFNEGRGAVNIKQHKSNEERIAAAKGAYLGSITVTQGLQADW